MPLTGRRLGEMFDRSDRWGRDRIAEVRADDRAEEPAAGTGNGEQRPSVPRNPPASTGNGERRPSVPRNPAGRAAPPGARAAPAAPAQPRPQPERSGDTTAIPGNARTGRQTDDAATAVHPLPRPAMEPWIATAPQTMPDAGTRQVPSTRPEAAPSSPEVSVAIRRTTGVAVTVVAAVAAVVSFAHMHDLAVKAGEGWRAWLLPLAVDGLIIAASMTMLVRRRQGKSGGALAWSSLILGISASLAANMAAAAPSWEGRIVAAWPPIALLLAYELLMQQVRDTRPR